MDRVFRGWKNEKDLGPGWCTRRVVRCADARGASWGEDGNIIVALNATGALSRVPAEGGTPQPVTKLQAGVGHSPLAAILARR